MELSNAGLRIESQPMFDLQNKALSLEAKSDKEFIHFEIGDPNFDTPPGIINMTIHSLLNKGTHYTHPQGIHDLKMEISYRDCLKHPQNGHNRDVLITPGCNISLFYAMSVLCNEGDEVILPNPGFPTYASMAKYLNLVPHYYNSLENRYGLSSIITSKTKLIVINSPSNPTGMLSKIECKFSSDWNTDKYYYFFDNVYEDIIYGEKYFIEYPINSIRAYSFSKSHSMTGFRLGYMIADSILIHKMSELLNITNSCVPEFIQRAGIKALYTDTSYMLDEYTKRMHVIVDGLNSINGISCKEPDGAFYVFPSIKGTGLSSDDFAKKMLEAGVVLLPGNCFGTNGEGYVRLSFASTTIKQIKEGLKRIKESVHDII